MKLIPAWLQFNSASITSLTQIILALAIALMLLLGRQRQAKSTKLLAAFFICIAGFCFTVLMITSTFLSGWKTWQYVFLIAAGALLLRFCTEVHSYLHEQRREAVAITWIAAGALLLALALATFGPIVKVSFFSIRIAFMFIVVGETMGCLLILFRRSRKLSRSGVEEKMAAARMLRAFAFTLFIPMLLVLWTLLYHSDIIPARIISMTVHITILNLGILVFEFTFVLIFLNAAPEASTIRSKMILSALATVGAIIAPLGQLTMLHYEREYASFLESEIERISLSQPGDITSGRKPARMLFLFSVPLAPSPGQSAAATTYFNRAGGLALDDVLRAPRVSTSGISVLHIPRRSLSSRYFTLRTWKRGDRRFYLGFGGDEFRQALNRFALPIIFILVIGTLWVIFFFPAFFRISLVQPLEKLITGVQQVEAGNLEVAVPIRFNDEVGSLTRSFNRMVGSLREMRQALQEINAHLEMKVIHRTAELSNANEKLQRYAQELESSNTELDAFAHSVAHDLKTPLTTLVGFAKILDKKWERLPEERIKENISLIAQSSLKMISIIDALLLLASVRQMENVPSGRLDMDAILVEVMSRLSDVILEAGARVTMPGDWPHAVGYPGWVEEVWVNYISNAVKYGGHPPIIELGYDPPAKDGAVRFWVRDNGQGISPEAQSRLFLPFSRLDQVHIKGMGLGLSIVRRIVERLGGEVGVESSPGSGTRFHFTLPSA